MRTKGKLCLLARVGSAGCCWGGRAARQPPTHIQDKKKSKPGFRAVRSAPQVHVTTLGCGTYCGGRYCCGVGDAAAIRTVPMRKQCGAGSRANQKNQMSASRAHSQQAKKRALSLATRGRLPSSSHNPLLTTATHSLSLLSSRFTRDNINDNNNLAPQQQTRTKKKKKKHGLPEPRQRVCPPDGGAVGRRRH